MIIKETSIEWNQYEWVLNNQRSLYWCEKNVLIIADLHLGKAIHFRQHGIPISNKVNDEDVRRLCRLLDYYKPKECWILGDFVHSKQNDDWKKFKNIVEEYFHTSFSLIKGNHDTLSMKELLNTGFTDVWDRRKEGDILFVHESPNPIVNPTISGHLHPGIRIPMGGKGIKKLPAFLISSDQIILPAFSAFSGFNEAAISEGMDAFVFNLEGVFKVESEWIKGY